MDIFIQNYINKLTINDVYNFALKNNITLTSFEAELLYYHVKNNWKSIINGNESYVLNDIKSKVSPDRFNQFLTIFNYFKNRYSNFLRH